MAQTYQQLNIEERERIQEGLWAGKTLRDIAEELGRSPSTLSRELKRNLPLERKRYTPRLAHERARETVKKRGQRARLKEALIKKYVIEKLQEDYSPEQIAGRLPIDHPGCTISHEAIYQFIYAQYHRGGYGVCHGLDLRGYLKRKHKARKRKKVPFQIEKGVIKDRISIGQRPLEVLERLQLGHWEGDSLVSKKSSVGLSTLVERVSGKVFITKIPDGKSISTRKVIVNRLQDIPPEYRKSLTVDNGSENAEHKEITQQLKIPVYFTHPYHAWERGTNENTNGLIRYYFPKGTDFATVTEEEIVRVEHRLNTKPRKRLGYRTPLEVFNQMLH